MKDYIKEFIEKKSPKKIADNHPWKTPLSAKKAKKDKEDKKYLNNHVQNK
ncbi:MAG TPA: hypothetical protein VN704_02335 [Verrucomicrobiae bacterium]|nr:hypothetical protein [Verrucomicrobiae bacterium]